MFASRVNRSCFDSHESMMWATPMFWTRVRTCGSEGLGVSRDGHMSASNGLENKLFRLPAR
jgi:hypothetical protein